MSQAQNVHQDYWDSFYESRVSSAVPDAPSAFAEWMDARVNADHEIAEFGFGTARDSLWFARQGRNLTGYEFAESAVRLAQENADAIGLNSSFHELDLYDRASTELVGKQLASREALIIYGRFLIHSLEDAGRHNLFDLAAAALNDGGALYLEFRTGQDRGEEHLFGDDHFRTYLDPETVTRELLERGATIAHSEAGHGLAVYKTEDPHVARVVARWGIDIG